MARLVPSSAASGEQPTGEAGRDSEELTDNKERRAFASAIAKINDLYTLRDTFFPSDPAVKRTKLEMESLRIVEEINATSHGSDEGRKQRAFRCFLRGRARDVGSEYTKEAEEDLSKAVKLDPGLVDAWACLGHCFWKKGDLSSAVHCLEKALARGPHKHALQHLSMLQRHLAKETPGEARQLIEDSVRHAKEAVALNIKDGSSWYVLGNAYLTQFFTGGDSDVSKLRLSLKAYQNAERDEAAAANPDLHFNSAVVHRYLEDYEPALAAFAEAGRRDPLLGAEAEAGKVADLLSRLHAVVNALPEGLGKRRPAKSPPRERRPGPNAVDAWEQLGIAELEAGPRHRRARVDGRVLRQVANESSVPLCFVLEDALGARVALSLYAVQESVVREGDQVTLLEPECRRIHVAWQQEVYSFPSVRVDSPGQLLLNGRPLKASERTRSWLASSFGGEVPWM